MGSRASRARRRLPIPALERCPTSAAVDPEAAPYYGGAGPYGVLLCHGFTGSPRSLRAWAAYLERAGYRVALPRLPGHGTSWSELNHTDWTDWYAAAERDFRRLRAECERVFVAGLSLGGGLALRLAEHYGRDVSGIVLVNPAVRSSDLRLRALPVLRHLLASLPGPGNDIADPTQSEGGYDRWPLHALHASTKLWRDIRDGLGRVNQPLLLYRSRQDHVLDPSSARVILASVASQDVTEVLLERSYHVATMDYDAELIFAGSAAFFARIARG